MPAKTIKINEDRETRQKKVPVICPLCGFRKRRGDCLVCRECDDNVITPLKKKLEKKNAKLFLEERFDEIVDVWGQIFDYVLEKGQETKERKQGELQEAVELRDVRALELSDQAEKDVAAIISSYRKGGKRSLCFSAGANRESLVETQLRKLERDDPAFKRVYGLGKAITCISDQLAEIREKRQKHLQEQAEKSAESTEATEAVA